MKKKFLSIALILAVLGTVTVQTAFAEADSSTTTATLSGSTTLTGAGSWSSAFGLSGNVTSAFSWASKSLSGHLTDYLVLTDADASNVGAKVLIRMRSTGTNVSSHYKYTTNSTAGNTGNLTSTNTYLMAFTDSSAPTYGKGNATSAFTPTATTDIAGTCTTYNVGPSNSSGYIKLTAYLKRSGRLPLSYADQRLVYTTNTCTARVRLGFNKVKVGVPANTTGGAYTSVITFTTTDGQT